LTKPEPDGKPLLHVVLQEEMTDEMAALLVGSTIEGLSVGLGADNRLYLKVSRPAKAFSENAPRREKNVVLVFNEYGIGVDK
jgi:hypothetical protein